MLEEFKIKLLDIINTNLELQSDQGAHLPHEILKLKSTN
jgi:hypothetical protein